MAFTAAQEFEPVKFGDMELAPTITAELKLRISNLSYQTEDDLEKAMTTLSKAFRGKEQEVKQFMEANMFPNDLARLATYLIAGPSGLKQLDARIDYLWQKEMDRYLEKAKSEAKNE